MIELICFVCGKVFKASDSRIIYGTKHITCSKKCQGINKTLQNTEERTCSICGEIYIVIKSQEKKFCSVECANKYKKTLTGENNKKCTKIKFICEWCGKEKLYSQYNYNKSKNHFCSNECRFKWRREVYDQLPEIKKERSNRIVKNLELGLYPQTRTGIHIKILDLLKEYQINFTEEKNLDFYSVDIYLEGYEKIIEIMGDYWHGNHKKYKEINYNAQMVAIMRDKKKNTFFNNKQIPILYLWEEDINNNIGLCGLLIKSFLTENKTKHSFDYSLYNQELCYTPLEERPFLEWKYNDFKKIVNIKKKDADDAFI